MSTTTITRTATTDADRFARNLVLVVVAAALLAAALIALTNGVTA